MIFGIIIWVQEPTLLFWFLVGLGQTYVMWLIKKILLDFNCHPMAIKILCPLKHLTCGVLKPGIWYQEREDTLKLIREKIAARGAANMTSIVDAADLKDESTEGQQYCLCACDEFRFLCASGLFMIIQTLLCISCKKHCQRQGCSKDGRHCGCWSCH